MKLGQFLCPKLLNLYLQNYGCWGRSLHNKYKNVKKGIENKWANSLLLKVNQIGTITEAVEATKLMFDSDMDVIVSHRSGETISTLISDLSVGIGAKYIKTDALAKGERVAKYNRLLQIEDFLNL